MSLATSEASGFRREAKRDWAIDERFGLPDRVTYGEGTLFPDGGRSSWVGTMKEARRVHESRWEALLRRALDALLMRDIVGSGRESLIAGEAGPVVGEALGVRRDGRDRRGEMLCAASAGSRSSPIRARRR